MVQIHGSWYFLTALNEFERRDISIQRQLYRLSRMGHPSSGQASAFARSMRRVCQRLRCSAHPPAGDSKPGKDGFPAACAHTRVRHMFHAFLPCIMHASLPSGPGHSQTWACLAHIALLLSCMAVRRCSTARESSPRACVAASSASQRMWLQQTVGPQDPLLGLPRQHPDRLAWMHCQ